MQDYSVNPSINKLNIYLEYKLLPCYIGIFPLTRLTECLLSVHSSTCRNILLHVLDILNSLVQFEFLKGEIIKTQISGGC